MVVAVDLVQDGLDVYSVITADVRERRGPSVVRRRIRIRHRCASRIGEGNRDRVDFGTEEIVDAFPAWAVRPFVGRVFVRPCSAQACGFGHLKYGVDAQIFVRQHGLAGVPRVAAQISGIETAAAVEPCQIRVDRFIHRHDRPHLAGAASARIAETIRLGGRRERAVPRHVVPKAGRDRRAAGQKRRKSRE